VRTFSRNNKVPANVAKLAIEYLAVMQAEGWGVSIDF
jgi:hypothetical protein